MTSGELPTADLYARPAAVMWALAAGAIIGIFLLRVPVQLTDSFTEFLLMQGRAFWDVVRPEFAAGPYLRPLRRGLIKVVFDLSQGNYYWWFRGLHALQVMTLFLLVVRLLRIRRMSDAAVIPLTLAMIAGFQTFADILREAFPINHFLTIVLAIAGVVALAQSRGGKAVDLLAIVLVVFSMLTIESGLLVGVAAVVAYAVGWRGISLWATGLVAIAIVSYLVSRFAIGHGALPGIEERNTGFGFSVADPEVIRQLFGGRLWPFYAYNVASAICCVLFAEPRGGIWLFTRAILNGELLPWQMLTVVSSVVTTGVIARHVATRFRSWRRLEFDDGDRLVVLFLFLLPANAVFAAVYEKDVILSPAGFFYALAAAVAIHALLFEERPVGPTRRALVLAFVAVLATAWTVRSIGVEYRLRQVARVDRNEWAYVQQWKERQGVRTATPAQRAIEDSLYDDAIWRVEAPPVVRSRVADRLFDPLQ